jgi:hypothetical protein
MESRAPTVHGEIGLHVERSALDRSQAGSLGGKTVFLHAGLELRSILPA